MLLLNILIMSKVLPENILRKQILLNLVTMGLCSIKAMAILILLTGGKNYE